MSYNKKDFAAYKGVQNSGLFNMITEAGQASELADLSMDTYFDIIRNYDEYRDMYNKEEEAEVNNE